MAARSYEPGSGQAVIIRKVSYSKISPSVSPELHFLRFNESNFERIKLRII